MFRHILNFLRDKHLNLPENFNEVAMLRQEADFYRIEPIINYLDQYFFTSKLNSTISKDKNSSSMTSLASISQNISDQSGLAGSLKQPMYFTLVSKLYQGSLQTYVGCIKLLDAFTSLDSNSKKFMASLRSQYFKTSKDKPNENSIHSFVCECKFMHEEKLINIKVI